MPLEDQKDALLKWVAANRNEEVNKVDDNQQVSQETTSVVPEVTEEPSKQVAQETLKETPKIEVEEVMLETPSSWDQAEENKEVIKPTSTFDFSKLGSALELGEVKDEVELTTKVSELRTKLKQLEEAPLSSIPEDFKEVLQVAKTGDWKGYLANQLIDFSKLDPREEFENLFFEQAVKNPKFITDGKFDEQLANEELDKIPEYLQLQYGKDILYRKSQEQAQIRQSIQAQAIAKQQAAETSLAQSTKNLQELLPFENYGIKFEPKHSSEIHEGITNSKLTKKHLGISFQDLVRSGADMKAVSRTIAASEYAEKMIKFKSDNSKVQAKKELLEKTQNAQVQTPGSLVTPQDPEKKMATPAQKMAEFKSKLHTQGRL